MTWDPNWFYSSLAQAAAAIVGIVGGFVLSAMLRQREQVVERRRALVTQATSIRDRMGALQRGRAAQLSWFENDFREALSQSGSDRSVRSVRAASGGVYGAGPWRVQDRDIEQMERLRTLDADIVASTVPERVRELLRAAPEQQVARSQDAGRWHRESRELLDYFQNRGDALRVLMEGIGPAEDFARELPIYFTSLQRARELAVPRSYQLSTLLLAFIAVVGVVMPLTRLSAYSASERDVFVWLFASGLLLLLAFIAWQFIDVRRLVELSPEDLDRPA